MTEPLPVEDDMLPSGVLAWVLVAWFSVLTVIVLHRLLTSRILLGGLLSDGMQFQLLTSSLNRSAKCG
ncbi:hypothetical protein UAJ10_02185 [Nitrospirillum sp. BR 11164]|uniref:hypothetical protein n=1 Tax=Nitrospirillum sp. BR 11164 TaxID=3104324 RepID=UPI002AFF481B|nr:hypothetical protein [Nitrospirillum sp. BR 11164]MEA1647828.1 hypothetical protein [Nitrospirillum sp. BR 11164]